MPLEFSNDSGAKHAFDLFNENSDFFHKIAQINL